MATLSSEDLCKKYKLLKVVDHVDLHVESGEEGDYPLVNGQPIGAQARKLNDNDVVQLAGVKMGFFNS